MRIVAVLLAFGLFVLALPAEQKKGPAKPPLPQGKPGEQIRKLIKQYDDAVNDLTKRVEAAKDEKEEDELLALAPDPKEYSILLLRIAEENPKDAQAIEALLWIVRNARSSAKKAKASLIRDYLADPKIGPFCRVLRSDWQDAETLVLLREILDKNPGKEAQAHAAFAIAKVFRARAGFAKLLQTNQLGPKIEKNFGKKVVTQFKNENPQALNKEAENLLERIIKDKDFSNTLIAYGESKRKMGDLAASELFEMRRLQPGMPAPEIVGEDIDGKAMKLSDFRDRVVLLDFWATG